MKPIPSKLAVIKITAQKSRGQDLKESGCEVFRIDDQFYNNARNQFVQFIHEQVQEEIANGETPQASAAQIMG